MGHRRAKLAYAVAFAVGMLGAEANTATASGPEAPPKSRAGMAAPKATNRVKIMPRSMHMKRALEPGDVIRGITVGPIESALHPGRGYGSEYYRRLLGELQRWGANWVSLTPFGRVWDLKSTVISPVFEAPYAENRILIRNAVAQAHALGMRVLLVPHLWVESGEWRGQINPEDDAHWRDWTRNYAGFVRGWAEVAEQADVDMLAVGVELRSWVTTARAPSFFEVLHSVRAVYSGLLTYAGNWDDIAETVILGELDVIGVNAFFPLADREGADDKELLEGGQRVAAKLHELSERWHKPLILTEFGYTTRPNPAVRPWEWPDGMREVHVDELAQARAYQALLSAVVDEPSVAGAFLWRLYSDPDDMSQEAAWGFSPRGKLAELVLRDAYRTHWARQGTEGVGALFTRRAAETPGLF